MRISDWSSDVCSSDLEAYDRIAGIPPSRIARLCRGACEGQWPRGAYGAGKDRGADDRALYRDRSWICDGTEASSSRRSGLIAHILFVPTPDGCEIGRAWGRERVFQYV